MIFASTRKAPPDGREPTPFSRFDYAQFRFNGPRSFLLLSNGRLHIGDPSLIPRQKINGPSRFRNVEGLPGTIGNKALLSSGRQPTRLSRGILVPGQTFNWWHFLLEVLPKAHAAINSPNEWASWDVILPRVNILTPNMKEALKLVLGKQKIEWAPADQFVQITDAVAWTGPIKPPEKMMEQYRDFLRGKALSFAQSDDRSRIFLLRSDHVSRKYNEPELATIARDFGFITIDPARCSLAALWAALSRAEAVIGAQGAGWANTIVCPAGAFGLQWSGGALRPGFETLAQRCRMNVRAFVAAGSFDGDYHIDPQDFRKHLDQSMRILNAGESRDNPGLS